MIRPCSYAMINDMNEKFHNSSRFLPVVCAVLFVILVIVIASILINGHSPQCDDSVDHVDQEQTNTSVSHPYGESDQAFFDTDSTLLIANKKHKLPEGYEPRDLTTLQVDTAYGDVLMRREASDAISEMFKSANQSGVFPYVTTAYRDEGFQATLYNRYASSDGIKVADTYSSRPGYSDHQTGLAADISCNSLNYKLTVEFQDTPEGKWLAEHAHEFGFVIRYPNGKEAVTGYTYEPWHFRYIGKEYATALYKSGSDVSMEEFFGIEGGDYAE